MPAKSVRKHERYFFFSLLESNCSYTLAIEPRNWSSRLPSVRLIATGAAVFIAAFVYTLPQAAELIDDHFMHVAWGRQLLDGRLPVRDMVALGMPLKSTLSFLFEWVLGHRLLSEGVLVGGAFALGALLTFVLATKASGHVWIGVIAAVLQIVIAPRTYNYSKIVLYATAILLLWRYIDKPGSRCAAIIGLFVAFSFYLRHDHGLYLGSDRLLA